MFETFFDYNSTTPVDPDVLNEMLPFFTECFANPSAQTSDMSWRAQAAIEKAKKQAADFIGCEPHEIIFTSGATESINWVFEEFFRTQKNVLVSNIDHDASFAKANSNPLGLVYEALKDGKVDLDSFQKICEASLEGSLVNIIYAHNELGTLAQIHDMVEIAKKYNHYVHVDATQALGKTAFHFKESKIDFLSCSAHKFYGPKGVGALVINSHTALIKALIKGGGQQKNLRSGTLNTPLIVGFGAAAQKAQDQLSQDQTHYETLKKGFLEELSGVDYTLNQDIENSLKNTLNITFKDWRSLSPLHLELRPYSVSQGSACSSESGGARVLKAIGQKNISGTLRISFGRLSQLENTRGLAKTIKLALFKKE